MAETIEQAAERVRKQERLEDLQVKLAERAFDERIGHKKSAMEQIVTFSNAAMRAPGLVAAGGVAASLGFYSANYTRLSPDALGTFNSILFWLFLSLIFTVLAPAAAYFSQLAFLGSYHAETRTYEAPYFIDTRRSIWLGRIGSFFQVLSILIVASSIFSLIVGGWLFLSLV